MLVKAKTLPNCSIYRKGIGYFLKLLQYLNETGLTETYRQYLFGELETIPYPSRETLIYALRVFTNIKNPAKYSKNIKKSIELLNEIVRFNVPPRVLQNKGKSGDTNIDQIAAHVIDQLACQYGWTPDYILSEIDYFTYFQLYDTIQTRKAGEIATQTILTHDPKQAHALIQKMQGLNEMTWEQLAANRRAKNG